MHAMYTHFRRTLLASTALVFALMLPPASAGAQAIFGAAEVDGDEVQLFLLGGAWSPGGLGWKPFGSVVGYMLRFPAGTATETRNVFLPTIGLMNAKETHSLALGVGYAFSDDDIDQPLLVPAESGDGVVASFGYNYWGTGNRMGQLLGSFNFGNDFLWTRGRAAQRLTPTSPLFVGGEAGVYGGGDANAFLAQFGPLVEWRFNPQFRLGLSAGLKVGIAEVTGNTTYGRLEFLWLPAAR